MSGKKISLLSISIILLSFVFFLMCNEHDSKVMTSVPAQTAELSGTQVDEEGSVIWDGISDFESGVTYSISDDQFELFVKKRPEMGELIMKAMYKRENGISDSLSEKLKADTSTSLSEDGGCDATASCGDCHHASAHAAAGPALADGYIELWAGFPGNSKYKYVAYHAGNPGLNDSISKEGSGGCAAGAIGHINGYCHMRDDSSC